MRTRERVQGESKKREKRDTDRMIRQTEKEEIPALLTQDLFLKISDCKPEAV